MANQEHLKILKQGVIVWNKWRKEHPDNKPDLGEENFHKANLEKIDLSGADLFRALFSWSNLRGAILIDAELSEADLREANLGQGDFRNARLCDAELSSADLEGANLSSANLYAAQLWNARLRNAVLHEAYLRRAILIQANLTCSNFTGADLTEADLREATLKGANLEQAQLIAANVAEADLAGANLSNAILENTNLTCVNFEKAILHSADLRGCNLTFANFAGGVLTGAKLYGTARDNWVIKDVECKYVYWDYLGQQRSPKDRDLEPGEFERLYAAMPIIEYIFEKGMSPIDPLIMDRVVQAIREKRPEFDIKIDSINARGLAPSIKFTVQDEEHKEPALEEVRKEYEDRINRLEAEKDRLYNLLGQAIDKAGDVSLITGSIVAMDNSIINIEQHIHNALELQKAIAEEPEESKSFAKVVKKTALDIMGGAIKDIAKGQVKEAAKQIIELGKDLGPIIAKKAAYAFFSSI